MTLHWREVRRLIDLQFAVIHLGLGTCITLGGPERFPPPSYDLLLHLSRGQTWPYGLVFLVIGAILAHPNLKVSWIGHVLAVIVLNVAASLFLVAVLQSPTAASSAPWMWFSMGTMHGFVLAIDSVQRRFEAADKAKAEDSASVDEGGT